MPTTTDEYADFAQDYENDTITYAREHPHIGEGMLVSVYDEATGTEFIGCGIVVRDTMRWSEFFCQYLVNVSLRDSVLHNIVAGRLERFVGGSLTGVEA